MSEVDSEVDNWPHDIEWPADRPVEEWVPGDPMPGYWIADFSGQMFSYVDDTPWCDMVWLYKWPRSKCWCEEKPDYVNTFNAYRWTPDLPEIEEWVSDEELERQWREEEAELMAEDPVP